MRKNYPLYGEHRRRQLDFFERFCERQIARLQDNEPADELHLWPVPLDRAHADLELRGATTTRTSFIIKPMKWEELR